MSNFNFNFNLDGSQAASVQPQAPAPETHEKVVDPRVWTTPLSKEVTSYSADIRILPESNIDPNTQMDNLNGYPSKLILMHRLRVGKSRQLVVKCLKRSLNDKTKGVCPYCDWVWNRYWLMKNADAKAINECQAMNLNLQEEINNNKSNTNYATWVCNVLIVNDYNHPEYNGQVKIWPHTDRVNDMLDNPKDPCEVEYRKRLRKAKKTDVVERPNPVLFKNVQLFTPEHPLTGHNFTVVCNESQNIIGNSSRGIPTYENSSFDPNATKLAETEEQMIAILSKRHDLEAYAYGDLPTYAEAQKKLNDWLIESSVANVPDGAVPASEATTLTAQNYNAVMSRAPAPAPKKMEQVSAQDYTQGYQPAAAPAFSIPAQQTAPKPAQQAPQAPAGAPTFSIPASSRPAPKAPPAQPAPQYNVPGVSQQQASSGNAMLDDDELPF